MSTRGDRVRQVALLVLLMACAVGVMTSRGAASGQVLTIGFLGSADDEDMLGALAFKELVERESSGRLRVRIYPAGQ
ncbi:MAG: hypothetical protein AAFX85_06190, partial [Pseudomonadota bacterium]